MGGTRQMTTIRFSRRGDVGLIRLDRPDKRNAMSLDMAVDVDAALDDLGDVRALVVTGDDVAFSAGADLAGMAAGEPAPAVTWHEVLPRLAALPLPTIAAIEGWCLGGGLEFAMALDLRIASETARLGLPEVTRGIFPGAGGTQRLPRLVGQGRAKELLFTGKHIDAETAERWGLVNEVVPTGGALDRALELASELAGGATVMIRLMKGLVHDGAPLPIDEALRLERERGRASEGSEDAREGITAFLEKRPPRFEGR